MRFFVTRRSHDPEVDAATYLDGAGTRTWRREFEEHLLDCEDCWHEVRAARTGRSLAERARELASPSLREDIRAAVLLSPAPPRRSRISVRGLAGFAIVATLVGSALLTMGDETVNQPEPISAALASYRSHTVLRGAVHHVPPDLSAIGLELEGQGRARLGSFPSDVLRYADASGAAVLLVMSDQAFPEAVGARERPSPVGGWQAYVDGLHLACRARPVPYLIIASSASLVREAESAMRAAVTRTV